MDGQRKLMMHVVLGADGHGTLIGDNRCRQSRFFGYEENSKTGIFDEASATGRQGSLKMAVHGQTKIKISRTRVLTHEVAYHTG